MKSNKGLLLVCIFILLLSAGFALVQAVISKIDIPTGQITSDLSKNNVTSLRDHSKPIFMTIEQIDNFSTLKIYSSESLWKEVYKWTDEGSDISWCYLTINKFDASDEMILFKVDSNVKKSCPDQKFFYSKKNGFKKLSNIEFLELNQKIKGYDFIFDTKFNNLTVLKDSRKIFSIADVDDNPIKISDSSILLYSISDRKIKLLDLVTLTITDYIDSIYVESFSYNPLTDLLIINDDKFNMSIIKFKTKKVINTYEMLSGKWLDDDNFIAIKYGVMPTAVPKDYIHDAYYIKNYKTDNEIFFSKGKTEVFTAIESENSILPNLSVPD